MAGTSFKLDATQIDRLKEAMARYDGAAGRVIDDVLHNEGGKLINDAIMQLLPASNRNWKGKKAAASKSQPFVQENGSLSVTIKTKPAYHYLYFPDDGTNTRNHVGNQQFMQRGADNVSERIVDLCISRLMNEIGE